MSNEQEKEPIEKFVLRIPRDLKKKVEAKASIEERSLNKHILALLKQDLEKK